ncbi:MULTISPECIES: DUF1836 domain-containing protein [Bacillus]|uniref:DUF1836 domain-containing protein n=1 Tax=Bacillus TaxID=1386 RepID=UPI0002F9DD59|nr:MULTISPECIES: DUF1836 domain-containing protein [Bacillus]
MDRINEYLEQLHLDKNISLEDMPEIDLYMDQVIQLFENKFNDTKRNEEEKVLTKTMINNYAKGKLFVPIKNKKYSKDHLILISLIYQLKGALSIKDIKDTLEKLNHKVQDEQFSLDELYKGYLNLYNKNVESFQKDVHERVQEVKNEAFPVDESDRDYLEKILLLASLVNMSNFYRRAAELIVDDLSEQK